MAVPVVIVLWYSTLIKSFIYLMGFIFCLQFHSMMKIWYGSKRPFWIEPSLYKGICDGGFGNPSGHSITTTFLYLSLIFLYIQTKTRKNGAIRRRGQIPSKRTINLAVVGVKPMRMGLAIPGIILILLAAAAFSKFLVIDRLNEVNAAQRVVYELQNELDAGYRELSGFDDLSNLYAHYTYSGFTNEELNRTDRVDVLRLIRTMIIPYAEVSSWSVTGNELTINMSAESLQQINLIVQQLEAQDLVDFCTVNTANTNDNTRGNATNEEYSFVRARVLAYLNSGAGVNAG